MVYLVYLGANAGSTFGAINLAVNVAHAVNSVVYMLVKGHYFKHDATRGESAAAKKGVVRSPLARLADKIALAVESNNYWNPIAILWNINTVFVPFIKMSYALEFGLSSPGAASTRFVDVCDAVGMLVTALYTVVVWY